MESGVYVGVDVSKGRLDVAIRPSGEFFSEANDERAISRVVKRLAALNCVRIVLEATGGYETVLAAALWAVGLPVVIVNPRWARAFAHGLGQLAKTDRLDARMLAQYAERPELKIRELPDAETRALKALCARREQLIEMLVAERHRAERAAGALRRQIDGHLGYLRKQLGKLDDDLDQAVRNSPRWREMKELLSTVPGVGRVLCAALIARLPELGRMNRGEVAALAGVAPINRDSGKLRGKRMIEGGRADLRRILYMSALCGIRHNPVLSAYYRQLRERGKPGKVALIAAMRKLLLILNAMAKSRTPWRPPCP
ncbi:MAG: IS110 family transposase, partial [Terriglobales bacterium]